MKETFNKQEINIIVTALLHEMERYNKAMDFVSDEKASEAIAEAKHRVYEVFKKANSFTEDRHDAHRLRKQPVRTNYVSLKNSRLWQT